MRIFNMITCGCTIVTALVPCALMAQDTIDSAALLGNWMCEDQNGVATLKSRKFYGPAGHAVTDFSMRNRVGDGEMGVATVGTWHLEGTTLVEQGKEYDFYTLFIDGENLLGSVIETALTVEMLEQVSRSEIKELNATRLVISPQGYSNEMICLRKTL